MRLTQDIRDSLFGDVPLDAWPAVAASEPHEEPWRTFVLARAALREGRPDEAIQLWRQICAMEQLESRHYAQAWHFLREQGIRPPANEGKSLLGVVVEVCTNDGLDLLAVYADRTARYFNFGGGAVIWEHPDQSLDLYFDALLAAGLVILRAIGPWDQARPPAPPSGQIRINLISPSGLHFGQGLMQQFAADRLAKPAVDAATAVLQHLVAVGFNSNGR